MSSTQTLISVDEYLNATYRPDCDYIDGQVLERNMGEKPHSGLQTFFGWCFRDNLDEWRVEAFTEQRVQVTERNYRIPDVSVISLDAPYDERILRNPPVLCIEILSSEDTMKTIQRRIDDYARMGVPCSWVVDPWKRLAFAAGPDAVLHRVTDTLTVPNTPISIPVAAIFAELDRIEKRAAARPAAS
jgi:Uma2 family endonuclease